MFFLVKSIKIDVVIWNFPEIVSCVAVRSVFDDDIMITIVRPVGADIINLVFVPTELRQHGFHHASITATAAHKENIFVFREEIFENIHGFGVVRDIFAVLRLSEQCFAGISIANFLRKTSNVHEIRKRHDFKTFNEAGEIRIAADSFVVPRVFQHAHIAIDGIAAAEIIIERSLVNVFVDAEFAAADTFG